MDTDNTSSIANPGRPVRLVMVFLGAQTLVEPAYKGLIALHWGQQRQEHSNQSSQSSKTHSHCKEDIVRACKP